MSTRSKTGAESSSIKHVPWQINAWSVLSLFGVYASIVLTFRHFELRSGTASFKSICNIGSAMNCDLVNTSRFAEIFSGFPLSNISAAGLFLSFLISIFARNAYWRREAIRAGFLLAALSSLVSLIYLAIMLLVIRSGCLFCFAIDAVNVLSLSLLVSLKPESLSKGPRPDHKKWKTFAWISALSLLGIPIILQNFSTQSIRESDLRDLVNSVFNSAPIAIQLSPKLPTLGNPQAPITIVEFSDFQCPHCKNGASILNTVLMRYRDQVKIVFRNFPLDPNCNPKIMSRGHPVACEAARVALCAQAQDPSKFQTVYELLFEHQSEMKPGLPLSLATQAGLDESQMRDCIASDATTAQIAADLREGEQLGVQYTPTFFLNGYKIEGAYPVPAWERMITQIWKKTSN